ncbi:MAG: methyltransferase domain-containing protein [Pseudomonadota bacterium]|nr:methyltransferase domain-containing protein [Pseudomonadota bacterium]
MPHLDASRFVARARTLTSPQEAREFYDAWAETYDDDVYGTLGVIGTTRIAALLGKFAANRDLHILDVGCGTGAGGKALRELGFAVVDGLDLSPGMLAVARRRGVYRHLIAADLLQPPALRPESYDAILSAGTFTTGHVDARPLPGLLDLVRPRGLLAFVVGSGFWSMGGFETVVADLNAEGAVELVHCAEAPIAADGRDLGHFLVLRRAAVRPA